VTERWTLLVVGIWILISPWVLGFSDISVAMWSNVLCGILLAILGAWSIFKESQSDLRKESQKQSAAEKSSQHPQK
jgi:uncharacterized membrane protein YccC